MSSVDYPVVPSVRFVRLPEVQAMTGLSKTEIYRRIREGSFPVQTKISSAVSVWTTVQIADWQAKMVLAGGHREDQLAQLLG